MDDPRAHKITPKRREWNVTLAVILVIVVTSQLHSQVLHTIPPLAFTMPAGGGNPLPQVLTVTAVGNNFDFGVNVSTSSGGNWLSIAGGPNCCKTPWAITANVTNVNNLAAGTYNGELAFTQFPSGNVLMTVPVTLFVESPSTPFIDALPGQLSFSMKTGGNAPPAQVFQVRNAGSGTLNWTLSTSTADGGNWLLPSVSTGTAPTSIAVAIDLASLPGGGAIPGTFVGQLLAQSGTDSVTVPISMTVGDSVFVQSNPVSFTMLAGGAAPLPQVLSIANTGTNFDFSSVVSTSSGGNWLSVSAGPNCCATPWAVTLNVANVSSLAAGTYEGEVTFNKFPSATTAITVPVTLFIEPANTPFFDALPGQMAFSMKTSGLPPPAQTIQVRNGGTQKLKWTLTATTADGGGWLKATSSSGTAPKSLLVSIVPALLPGGGTNPGSFVGQLLFQSGTDSITVPVSTKVGDSVFAQFNPINFTMAEGGSNPLPQVLSVASSGGNFDFSTVALTSTGGNWLSFSAGPNCCSTSWALIVTVANTSTLRAGAYMGQIMLNKFPNANFAMAVPVTLTVVAAGKDFPGSLPGQSSFSLLSPSKPSDQIVPVADGGPGALNWTSTKTTADGGKWLTDSPTKGTTPSVVNVHVNTKKLPGGGLTSGTYIGQQIFKSPAGSVTVPVSVTVGNSAFVALNAMTFTAKVGTNPPPQTVTVTSTGTNFDFGWLSSTGSGGNWLNLTGGVNCCRTPWTVTVNVNSSTLSAGTYIGQAIFTPFPNAVTAMTVPVILSVTP